MWRSSSSTTISRNLLRRFFTNNKVPPPAPSSKTHFFPSPIIPTSRSISQSPQLIRSDFEEPPDAPLRQNGVLEEQNGNLNPDERFHAQPLSGEENPETPIDDFGEKHIEESGNFEGNPASVDEEQVQKLLSVLQSTFDKSLVSVLRSLELELSDEFVLRVVGTPYVQADGLIVFSKWVFGGTEISKKQEVVESLVRVVRSDVREYEAYMLWDFVKELGEKEERCLSREALNGLIQVFRELGRPEDALEVFRKFDDFRCERNCDSYYFTIEGLCHGSMFDSAWQVCEEMLNAGEIPDSEKNSNLVCYFCKGKRMKDAHFIYLMAKEKNVTISQRAFSILISHLCWNIDTVSSAYEMLRDIDGKTRKYSIRAFSSVVHGLCRINDLNNAKKLLLEMIDLGPPPYNAVFNSVIHGFCKNGDMEEAVGLLRLMETRRLKPNVNTYTAIISGFVRNDKMDEACKFLAEAKRKHAKLEPATYHTIIRGYVRMDNFAKALEVLSEMRECGVTPNADEYGKLIQSLCLKNQDWRSAQKLLEEMSNSGVGLDSYKRALISAVKELEEEGLESGDIETEEQLSVSL